MQGKTKCVTLEGPNADPTDGLKLCEKLSKLVQSVSVPEGTGIDSCCSLCSHSFSFQCYLFGKLNVFNLPLVSLVLWYVAAFNTTELMSQSPEALKDFQNFSSLVHKGL